MYARKFFMTLNLSHSLENQEAMQIQNLHKDYKAKEQE